MAGPYLCDQFGGLELSVDKDTKTKSRKYRIRDASDEDVALTFLEAQLTLAGINPYYTGLKISNIKLSQLPTADGRIYDADVTWTSNPRLEVGEYRIRVSGSGSTVTMTHDLETVEVQGDLTSGELKGAINVNQDGEAQGVDVYIPSLSMSVERSMASGTLTFAYIAGLEATRGTVNSATWNGFAAGEVLFTDFEASSGNTEMDRISFTFEIEPNVASYLIAGYTFSSKQGHDYVDVGQSVKYDKTKNIRYPVARWAAIHRVYRRSDFATALGW